ncbi:MAG: spoI [Solirubrobacterales bacterium]|nr:spoI [Solirubrobacterales bacterium]
MPASPPFEIVVHEEAAGRHRVVVSGELDLATVPDLRAQLRRTARAAKEVYLDLTDVTFIDSSGLSLLVGVDAESRADGFGFALEPGPVVLRLIELCDLQDVLPVRR